MNFSVLDAEGSVQKSLSAASLEEACQSWAHESWKDAVADDVVVNATHYDLGAQGKAAFLDPNLITPAGTERECLAKHQERLLSDPHFAPDPSLSERPRTIDTGGGG
jgi:hypothetical protein